MRRYETRPHHASTSSTRLRTSRQDYTWAIIALPVIVILSLALVLFLVPEGHEGVEGGPVDHNWGGHGWHHGFLSGVLLFFAYYFYVNRKAETPRAAWATNPYAVLLWCIIAWGAGAYLIDGLLTAFVGDDTTWTHDQWVQAPLQVPFVFGLPIMGALAGIRHLRMRRLTAVHSPTTTP